MVAHPAADPRRRMQTNYRMDRSGVWVQRNGRPFWRRSVIRVVRAGRLLGLSTRAEVGAVGPALLANESPHRAAGFLSVVVAAGHWPAHPSRIPWDRCRFPLGRRARRIHG